jgi:hypothetical protein
MAGRHRTLQIMIQKDISTGNIVWYYSIYLKYW